MAKHGRIIVNKQGTADLIVIQEIRIIEMV